jgi:hypothetical protein
MRFAFGTLVPNSLTRSLSTIMTPLPCYILIPGEDCTHSFPKNVIQENAPSIDFDHSRQPSARCDDYGRSTRAMRSVGEMC